MKHTKNKTCHPRNTSKATSIQITRSKSTSIQALTNLLKPLNNNLMAPRSRRLEMNYNFHRLKWAKFSIHNSSLDLLVTMISRFHHFLRPRSLQGKDCTIDRSQCNKLVCSHHCRTVSQGRRLRTNQRPSKAALQTIIVKRHHLRTCATKYQTLNWLWVKRNTKWLQELPRLKTIQLQTV